jgi:arsenite methyltransferase
VRPFRESKSIRSNKIQSMESLKEKIKEAYTEVLIPQRDVASSCCGPSSSSGSSCCGPANGVSGFNEDYSQMPGYDPEADYGLGCGIPVEFAGIKPGQTVLDLGSGAGNDVFVVRSIVGESGKVVGVDMTPAMIAQANKNKEKLGYQNVEFILGDIEDLPIGDHSIDTVISNCVLNLVSDKLKTYKGIYRALKPGGHFSISDVVVSGPLTEKMRSVVELYAGCISGAMIKQDYLEVIKKAGFEDISVKKEKVVYLPDSFLLQYLNEPELIEFRASGVQVLSVTVYGER